MFRLETTTVGLDTVMEALVRAAMSNARAIMEQVGADVIGYLKSLTSEIRPPERDGGPERHAHPGHWADAGDGDLAASYSYEVQADARQVILILRNTSAHAVYLEMHEGFFVLRGVADPGGPVEQAMRRAVAQRASGWDVRTTA